MEALADHRAAARLRRPLDRVEIHAVRRVEIAVLGVPVRLVRLDVLDDPVRVPRMLRRRRVRFVLRGDRQVCRIVGAVLVDGDVHVLAGEAEVRLHLVGLRDRHRVLQVEDALRLVQEERRDLLAPLQVRDRIRRHSRVDDWSSVVGTNLRCTVLVGEVGHDLPHLGDVLRVLALRAWPALRLAALPLLGERFVVNGDPDCDRHAAVAALQLRVQRRMHLAVLPAAAVLELREELLVVDGLAALVERELGRLARPAVDGLHHLDVLAGHGLVEREPFGLRAVDAQAHDVLDAQVRPDFRIRVGDDERDLEAIRQVLAALRHELGHRQRVRTGRDRLIGEELRRAAVARELHAPAKAVRECDRTARGLGIERRRRVDGELWLAEHDFIRLDAGFDLLRHCGLLGLGARFARAEGVLTASRS